MKVKTIIDEDFTNYKKCSMYICTHTCSLKCGEKCHNKDLLKSETKEISNNDIIKRYISNRLTSAVVISGLEPFDDFDDVFNFISDFRQQCADIVCIYSGYEKEFISNYIRELQQFPNIIIKYGKYLGNHKSHYDEVLGINLASDNQYGEVIS